MSFEPEQDTSTPSELPPGASVALRIGERWDGEAEGVVRVVEPLPATSPEERQTKIRIVLDSSRGDSELLLVLPRGAAPPVAVGEPIEVASRSEVLGIHPVTDLWICSGGELRLASSDKGDPHLALGWEICAPELAEAPPAMANGMAVRIDPPVLFRHRGALGAVGGNLWRRLMTPEGSWWISGHAVDWGLGNLPPDASTYLRYSLIRGPR